jgi:hypothetical protein
MSEAVESLNCAARVELLNRSKTLPEGNASTIQQGRRPAQRFNSEAFNRAAGPLNGAAGTTQREILF